MALYSQSEFALKCGLSKAYISVNKKRGKIILSGDYVDDSIEPNRSFLLKALDKSAGKAYDGIEVVEKKESEAVKAPKLPNVEPPQIRRPDVPNTENQSEPKDRKKKSNGGGVYELSNSKLELQIENLELKNRELEQKLRVREGETIPKEPVVIAFSFGFKNMCSSIKVEIENLITRYEKCFTPEQFADIRSGIVQKINSAQINAVAQSKKNIAEIILISSTKKEVGERE